MNPRGIYIIKVREKSRRRIAAIVQDYWQATFKYRNWKRRYPSRIFLKWCEPYAKFPVYLLENLKTGKFTFLKKKKFLNCKKKVPRGHILYEIKKPFMTRGGKDEMGNLDHFHGHE